MEVTVDNFEEMFAEMSKKIEECDFCSIDCELSGITNFKILNSFDTPKTRYEKLKKNSSFEFLSEQNFDFNKVFSKGISFMSKDAEESARHKLMQQLDEVKKPKGTIYPSNNKEVREQIDKLILLRIYIEKNLKQKYSQLLKYEYKFLENKERLMVLSKKAEKEQPNELELLEKEIGFSKLIWFLSKSGKLIVGHNMLTDIMQMLRMFFSSPLPDNFEDFKSMTTSIFPKLLDTKYMASLAPLKELVKNTTLGDMEKILAKDPFPNITIENCKYSTKNEKLHEAGYDAFLTGYCYLRMLHYLESLNSNRNNLIDFYSNKIFLMKVYDLFHIDLKNNQEEPKRENAFYIEFPSYWEYQDIIDLFSPFGSVFVGWIDDQSAFVALQNPDNMKKAAGQLVGVSGREYRVYFYLTYVNQISKNKGNKVISKFTENNASIENGKNNQQKTSTNSNNNNNSNGNGTTNNNLAADKRKHNTLNSQNIEDNVSNKQQPQPNSIETNSNNANEAILKAENVKKIKIDEASKEKLNETKTEKPFEECMDW